MRWPPGHLISRAVPAGESYTAAVPERFWDNELWDRSNRASLPHRHPLHRFPLPDRSPHSLVRALACAASQPLLADALRWYGGQEAWLLPRFLEGARSPTPTVRRQWVRRGSP